MPSSTASSIVTKLHCAKCNHVWDTTRYTWTGKEGYVKYGSGQIMRCPKCKICSKEIRLIKMGKE